jgi:hypothetical protein
LWECRYADPTQTHCGTAAPPPNNPLLQMPAVCAVCSIPASSKCARCKSVSYCSPAHQKAGWKAHKVDCPRLAQEALAAVFHPCEEELLLRITTCLAQNGYYKEVGVMVQLSKAFWTDEQIWDACPWAWGKDTASVRKRPWCFT